MRTIYKRLLGLCLATLLALFPIHLSWWKEGQNAAKLPVYAASQPESTEAEHRIEYRYDRRSRLIETSEGVRFAYDGAGRVTLWESDTQRREFKWDEQGRLMAVQFNDGTETTYQYDLMGRLVERTNRQGETTRFVYDGLKLIQERRSNESVIASYVYTEGLEHPVLMVVGERIYLFVGDRLGSVISLIDVSNESSHEVVARYRYDAWGNILEETARINQPFRFASYIWEPDAELYYLNNRWYAPSIGRFIAPDPLLPTSLNPQAWNPYVYAANDPVNNIDTMGLRSEPGLSRGYSSWEALRTHLNHLPEILVEKFRDRSSFSADTGLGISKTKDTWTGLPRANSESSIGGWQTNSPEAANVMFNSLLGSLPKPPQGFTPEQSRTLLGLEQIPQRIENILLQANQLAFPELYGESWVNRLLTSNLAGNQPIELTETANSPLTSLVSDPDSISAISSIVNEQWKRPGGVSLNESAKALAQLTDITGAVWDDKHKQLIITGKKGNKPGLQLNDLLVAIKALYSGEEIGLSIDPVKPQKKEKLPNYMSVRYIPEQIKDTNLGHVMFESDRQLKVLSLGRDIVKGTTPPTIPGYQSQVARIDPDDVKAGKAVWNRIWIEPKSLSISVAPGVFKYDSVALAVRTESFEPGPPPQSLNSSDPDAASFVAHLDRNYSQYAAKIPIFKELEQVIKLIGVAKWLRSESIPVDLAWLSERISPKVRETPLKTPAGTFYSKNLVERKGRWYRLGLYGGISTAKDLQTTDKPGLSQFAENLLKNQDTSLLQRISQDEFAVWIALQMQPEAGGSLSRTVDLPISGESSNSNPMLNLTRYSDSLRPSITSPFPGWSVEPAAIEFPELNNPHQENGKAWQRKIVFRNQMTGASLPFELVRNAEEHLMYRSHTTGAVLKLEGDRYSLQIGSQTYQFDLLGKLQSFTLPEDATRVEYKWNEKNDLTQISHIDSGGKKLGSISLKTNAAGQITEAKNQSGQVRYYEYDAQGHLHQVKDKQRSVLETYTYDDAGRLVQVQGANGEIKYKATLNSKGAVTSIKPEGLSFSYEADGSIKLHRNNQVIGQVLFDPETGQVSAVNGSTNIWSVEPNGSQSTQLRLAGSSTVLNVQTDPQGFIETVNHSESGPILAVVRDLDNRLLSFTDTDSTTNLEYDKFKRLHKIIRGFNDHAFEILHQDNGNVAFKDADGTILQFDRQGYPWVNVLQLGEHSSATLKYDASGQRIELTTPAGEKLQLIKDEQGRLTGLQTPFGRFEVKPDRQGGVLFIDGAGRQLQFKFDQFGKPNQIHDSVGGVLKLDRDAANSAITITRPDGTTVELQWDVGDRLIEFKDSQGRYFNVQYDSREHIFQINAAGTPLQANYNGLGQLTQLQQGANWNIQIEHDYRDRGQITSIKGTTGKVVFEQDPAGRIVHHHDVKGRDLWHVHSRTGKVIRTAYPPSGIPSKVYELITGQPTGLQVFSDYNDVGLVKSISLDNKDRRIAEFDYDADGRVTQIKAGGVKIQREYAGGFLTSRIQVIAADGNIMDELSYVYDESGRCIKESSPKGDRTFSYDGAGRLVEVKEGDRYKQRLKNAPNGDRLSMLLKEFRPDPTEPDVGKNFDLLPRLNA